MFKRNLFVAVFVLSLFLVPLALTEEAYGTPDFDVYYDQLPDDEKAIFGILADPYGNGSAPADNDWNPSVTVTADAETVESIAKLMVLEDPGRYYWLWIAPVLNEDNTLTFTSVEGFDVAEFEEETENFVKDVKSGLEQDHSFVDAAKAIDVKLRAKVKYVDDEDKPHAGTAYGAIVLGEADAFGFAAAFNHAVKKFYNGGFDVLTVAGKLHDSEGYSMHAWNVAKNAEGTWFGVDVALNKINNTGEYAMVASNDKGSPLGHTFASSHQQDLPGYTGLKILFEVPEPHMREILPPEPPTMLEKYGSHVFVITIITVLCIVMIVYSRRG